MTLRPFSLLALLLLTGCARPMPTPPASLAGTAWLAESIDERGVIDRLQSTLAFDDEGGVSGNAGCNQFFGPYEADDATLTFGALGMTKRMCAPAVMDQETAFTQALERTASYAISETGFLHLADVEGMEVLRLAPHEAETGDE